MTDHRKKPRHVRREKPKNQIQFTCLVDQALFDKANKVRKSTWVALTEGMMQMIVTGSLPREK